MHSDGSMGVNIECGLLWIRAICIIVVHYKLSVSVYLM